MPDSLVDQHTNTVRDGLNIGPLKDTDERAALDHAHDSLAWLSARAATADQLEQALRPFVDEYDFHAADYLADDEDARVFTGRTVDLLIEHQSRARRALAGGGQDNSA